MWGCLAVYGPHAAEIAGRVARSGASPTSAAFQNARLEYGGEPVVAARRDALGLVGFLFFAAAGTLSRLGQAMQAEGAALLPAEVVETLRIEAGEPAFLVDMGDDAIPTEAGIESMAVSYLKGCFPGQEVLVRIRDRGHGKVVRKLVGLTIEGEIAPAAGSVIVGGDKEIGHVTSAVVSPALGKPIALGYVHRDFVNPGTGGRRGRRRPAERHRHRVALRALNERPQFGVAGPSAAGPVRAVPICARVIFACPPCALRRSSGALRLSKGAQMGSAPATRSPSPWPMSHAPCPEPRQVLVSSRTSSSSAGGQLDRRQVAKFHPPHLLAHRRLRVRLERAPEEAQLDGAVGVVVNRCQDLGADLDVRVEFLADLAREALLRASRRRAVSRRGTPSDPPGACRQAGA